MSYPSLQTGQNPAGLAWASLGGMQLHSRIDPRREALKLASAPEVEAADLVIVLGFGLGYTVEALVKAKPERPVMVIEPEPAWLDTATELRRASADRLALPETSLVQIIKPRHADELIALLQEAGSRNPGLIINPAIAKADPELAEVARSAHKNYRDRFQVNANTLDKFGHLWVRNLARNLDTFAIRPGIADLEAAFAGIPGLLLAGGPSLDKVLPLLPELRRRFVLVAVDTSLRACLRSGVDPDFVVMVDPQYWNTRHLDGCSHSRAIVISESSVFPRALRLSAGPILFCSSLFPLGQFFEERIGHKGLLGAGGSVATSAWDFLRHLGIVEVMTAGLDLSFPDGHTHFAGSVFEEATHQAATRLRPAAMPRYDYLYNAGTYACADDEGRPVLSDRRMDIYVQWFENQFRRHPQMKTCRLNATSRRIEGLGLARPADCLAYPDKRARIDAQLEAFLAAHQPSGTDSLRRLAEARTELVAALRDLSGIARAAMDQTALARKACSPIGGNTRHLEKLEMLDQDLARAANNRIIGFLIEKIIQEVSTAAPPKTMDEALDRSQKLYEGLEQACGYHLDLYGV